MDSDDELDGAIYGHIKAILDSTSEEKNVKKKSPGGGAGWGSAGKAANIERDYMEAGARVLRKYF